MTKKKCGRCQVVLEYSKFAKNKARRDGLQSHCKMCRKNIGKQHYQKHKADYRDRGKQWIKENPEKWKNYRRTWANNKYKNNPSFRVLCSVKATMYDALFRQKALREEGKTGVYLGCTIEELKRHLEVKFKPGMTWENHGEWHVDHRRPCASFDLTKEEDIKMCFHYTNLQPLWSADNIRKRAKFDPETFDYEWSGEEWKEISV